MKRYKSQQLIDQLAAEDKGELNEDFLTTLQRKSNTVGGILTRLGFGKAGNLETGTVNTLVQEYQRIHQALIQDANNYQALEHDFVNVLPGIAENPGPAAWSRVNSRVYARLTGNATLGETTTLQIRVLPSVASGVSMNSANPDFRYVRYTPSAPQNSVSINAGDLADVPIESTLLYPNQTTSQVDTINPVSSSGMPPPSSSATASNGFATSASAGVEVASTLEVDSVTATAEQATYTIIFPPIASVCATGSSLSAQTKATPTHCPPTTDYVQLTGSAVPVEGSTVTIQVTFTNTSSSAQQAPGCISVTAQSSGSAGWWTFPAASQDTAPPVGTAFTSASACTGGSSTNEASLTGSGTVPAGSTAAISYAGIPTWTAFALEAGDGWSPAKEAVETSLGVTHAATSAVDALGSLPEGLATTGEVLGAASVAVEAVSFADGLIDLGSVESVPWVTYSVQVPGAPTETFEAYAQPEKMAILDALLWDLKWRMVPVAGPQPGLPASVLNGLQKIHLGTSDCVYQIVSAGGSGGPPYSWFYGELETSAGDEVPSSISPSLANYVSLGSCTWTGFE